MEYSSTTSTFSSPAAAPVTPPPRKSRHRGWIWLIVLLIFGGVFWWVLHSDNSANAPAGGRRAGAGGQATATTVNVSKGDLGIYLSAIGTVTPLNTTSIVSQVTGEVIAVNYREGQLVRKGDSLVEINPRPFAATLKQVEGTLERDSHLLEQEKMDLARYQAAWARNAIAKQQVDDQEKLVLQRSRLCARATRLLPYHLAHQRPGGPAAD
jgi:multidrug efflux system membrane fusion protein